MKHVQQAARISAADEKQEMLWRHCRDVDSGENWQDTSCMPGVDVYIIVEQFASCLSLRLTWVVS